MKTVNFKETFVALVMVFVPVLLFSQTTVTYTSSGTWVCPIGVNSVTVECWGAGGGGGNSNNGTTNGGSGGGGGAYCKSTLTVTPGNTYYFNVGSAGSGAPASSSTSATSGGATWFNSTNSAPTSTAGVLAGGGGFGGNNGGTIGAAGVASYWLTTGTNGSVGVVGYNNGGGNGGAGANGGAGGAGSATTNGANGSAPGGGGGGSDDVAATYGGNGGAGSIVLTYTCSPVSSFPWTEGFESGFTDASAIAGCWSQNSTTGSAVWMANSTLTTYNRTPKSGSFNATLYYSNEDWLFYPFTFTAGNTYLFEMYARQDMSSTSDASIAVAYGTSASSAAMTNTIVAQTGITNGAYQLITGTFTPSSSGTYYIGIKGTINNTPWYISIDDMKVSVAAPMSFVSSTTTQNNTASLASGATNQEIVGIQVVTTGTTNPLTASSFTFNTAGSTNVADIANAKLWTSGTTSSFASLTQLGSATISPNGTFTITGGTNMPYTLASGTNYFWLTYDVVASPTIGNVLDATCTSIAITSDRTPTVTNPNGSRTITLAYCNPAPSSVDGNGIINVSIGSINNTTGVETNNYGDYSALSTSVQQGESALVNITYATGFTYDTKIWVDWNIDGDFSDIGEEVFSGTSASANPTTLVASFVVPVSASLGNHRMRIGGVDSGVLDPCYTGSYGSFEDYSLTITTAATMAFSSCTTTQTNTNTVAPGSTSQEIIGVQIITTGVSSPLKSASFTFNTTGTTSVANIANAKLWTTGTSSAFATTTQLGNTIVNPNGTFTITDGSNMPYTLSNGTNYFWLTYDIVASPTLNDVLDATCSSITVSSARTPTVTTPTGSRTISLNYCTPTYSSGGSSDNITQVVLETLDDVPPANNSPYYFNRSSFQNDIPILTIGQTHTLSLTFGSHTTQYSRVWIDFNQDGDFADANESFDGGNTGANGTANISIAIPGAALSGQTRMRIRGGDDSAIGVGQQCDASSSSYGQAVDYFVNIATAVNMSYVSSSATQLNINIISTGSTNQEVICMKVVTSGSLNPISVTEFRMRTDGTTASATDIRNAKIWYTGNSSSFATTNQMGTTFSIPPSSGVDMVFAVNQVLSPGANYFWMTYDIPLAAVNGNFADATFQSLTVNGVNQTPTLISPAEKREIIRGCLFSLTLKDDASDGWNGGKLTVKVDGSVRLSDVTFTSGSSSIFQFIAQSGQLITTEYTAGSYSSENSYFITNPNGAYVTSSGEAQTVPENKSATADCNAVKKFTTNVNTYQSGESCFIITESKSGQKGSVWSNYKIDMTQNFTVEFDLFFGNSDSGADGIVFALQGSCTSAGGNGMSIGFGGISNSLGVEFDTYNNGEMDDLASDHIAIISNGSADHGLASNLVGPTALANIEDNLWHPVKISWDATSKVFKVKYGTTDSLSYTGDIVSNLFAGNNQVFWGFTGATGECFNKQQVCITSYPQNSTSISDTAIDAGTNLNVAVATGATSYTWIPNDGSISDPSIYNPVLTPTTTTEYTCLLEDGCGNIITNRFIVQVISDLPIELSNFFAVCLENNKVKIDWQTASELNNDYFIIEKSTDLKNYSFVSKIKGVGNSTLQSNYSIFDVSENNLVYYRLSQVDFNGKHTVVKVIPVECFNKQSKKDIFIYPNPAMDSFKVTLPQNSTASVVISNIEGKSVGSYSNINSNSILDISHLQSGLYVIKLYIDQEIFIMKLTKL